MPSTTPLPVDHLPEKLFKYLTRCGYSPKVLFIAFFNAFPELGFKYSEVVKNRRCHRLQHVLRHKGVSV